MLNRLAWLKSTSQLKQSKSFGSWISSGMSRLVISKKEWRLDKESSSVFSFSSLVSLSRGMTMFRVSMFS